MELEEALIDTFRKWDEAIVRNNVEEINQFMSDDWVCIGTEGITLKSSFLDWIKSGSLVHNKNGL